MRKLLGAYGLGLAALWMIWLASDAQAGGVRLPLVGGALWAVVSAGLHLVQWALEEVLPRLDAHRLEAVERSAITADSELVKRMADLEPWQAEALMRWQTSLVATPGVAGAVLEYDLAGERVPLEFVRDFMQHSSGEHLRPVRAWPEGTKGREWAQHLTAWFVSRGLARPAIGNQPARWIYSSEQAGRWLGLLVGDDADDLGRGFGV